MPGRVVMLDPNSHTLPYDRALARAVAAAGWQVELAVSPFLYEPAATAGDPAIRHRFFGVAAGAPGRWLGLARRARLRRAVKAVEYPVGLLALAAALARRPPDVLHVQWSLQPALEAPLWRWLRRRGVRVVYTVHNLRAHDAVTDDPARTQLYRAADTLMVHSDRSVATLIAGSGVAPERIIVAPHGPLLEDEPVLPPADARRRLRLPPDVPLILFAGLIEPYKGLPDLVAAFIALAPGWPAARLVIAGRPNVSVQPERDRLADAGLSERIHLDLRFLPQFDLAAYLCAADIIVLPYRDTTTSGLLTAARRFGRPVVATDTGDLGAVIADGVDGLLAPPRDPAALARAITRLLADGELRSRLGEAGQRAALERDTWDHAARQTLRAYGPPRART